MATKNRRERNRKQKLTDRDKNIPKAPLRVRDKTNECHAASSNRDMGCERIASLALGETRRYEIHVFAVVEGTTTGDLGCAITFCRGRQGRSRDALHRAILKNVAGGKSGLVLSQ